MSFPTSPPVLVARHIQNFSEASSLQHHWGYADRAVPCTNDPGSCAYLDVVYHAHDVGILYTGILWATIAGIVFIWAIVHRVFPMDQQPVTTVPSFQTLEAAAAQDSPWNPNKSFLTRLATAVSVTGRRYLLPEGLRLVFGRTTRLQISILAALAGYLMIWSFVGITFRTWITPVKKDPSKFNTRTSLGPFSDRLGVLAYALTPLSILLSQRESLLSVLTGVPYHHFTFLHRWLGHMIFIQSSVHTIGWCVIQLRLYQPQPSVGLEWIKETYIVWGLVAMILLTLLWVLSTRWAIRTFGYEFFRKSHYVLAMVYIGACWAHWSQLKIFLLPSLLLWLADRLVRLFRTFLLHYRVVSSGQIGFQSIQANTRLLTDDQNGHVVRLDFTHHQQPWQVGQHFFICFLQGSIWQSHPFTPLSVPSVSSLGVTHSYLFRAKSGETKKIADLLQCSEKRGADESFSLTPIIITGPYGQSIVQGLNNHTNILCIAGGTGISFVLPVLLSLDATTITAERKVELVWAIRREKDIEWVQLELKNLHPHILLRIFVTRQGRDPTDIGLDTTGSDQTSLRHSDLIYQRPCLSTIVPAFINQTSNGSTRIIASGPGGMVTQLRTTVAQCNDGGKVWKGDDRFNVKLVTDERLEE